MKDGRRGFLGGMAAVGAVAATASPVKAIATQLLVPEEIKKGLTDGSTIMRVSLVELVNGRRVPCKDHPTKILVLNGNFDSPGIDDVLLADPVSWDVTRTMLIDGIRIFGGTVGSRPYQNFAWFSAAPSVRNGDMLTVHYMLNFHSDIMSDENRDRPLRDLINDRERVAR